MKSENSFKKRSTVKTPEESEKDPEEKKYLERSIRIKITVDKNDDFISSFLKLSSCVPINIQMYFKKCFPHSKVKKKSSLKFFLQKCGLNSKVDMLYNKM